MVDCIDLRETARPRRWRWRFEESYQAEQDPAVRGDGRWYVEIICRRGLIYPAGGDDLLAFTDVRGVARELRALGPEVRPHQSGDGETVVRFPSRLLDRVAEVLRPLRLPGREATAEDRERLARTAFLPRETGLETTIGAEVDPEADSSAGGPV